MKVLIAPNAFKGTLSASEAASILSEFILEQYPSASIDSIPIGDGGDGTCELLTDFLNLEKIAAWSLDALGRPVFAFYGLDVSSRTIYLDVSSASGITHLKLDELNPRVASTFGTGLLIKDSLKYGIKNVVLGLGGSASIDLGFGILQGLGFEFLDQLGRAILPFSDHLLSNSAHIQRSPKIPELSFQFLCDVNNPFFGENGAIPVFGPQKGLISEAIKEFEKDSERVIQLLYKKGQKNFVDQAGFGAAGGIALGLSAFFSSEINFGASFFFDQVKMEKAVAQADMILTGEGRFDGQSLGGKGCFELLQLAKKFSKPIQIITSGDEAYEYGFQEVIQLPDLDFSKPDFQETAKEQFKNTIKNKLRIYTRR
ncbi:glycerate kinase [Algoriphagus kandeliae]|uniref:Glycerate kinase n=1 Tax=Algoriphagus kandeliae TaxID=2562278 RepID=A0A4Y9R2Q3_9BACT|nr:glycerate kinase [Algoriphagus kandeliae]TFV97786.1 glycerate kinase [Algoriphagus kandeliae]